MIAGSLRRPGRAAAAALIALLLAAGLLLSGCTGDTSIKPMRVFFVGNSYTAYNGGIDADLRGLAPRVTTASSAPGGYTLARHLNDQATMDALDGGWDYVVLQEQSQGPVYAYSDYVEAATTLTKQIKQRGGTPMLLMTWARPDSEGVTTEALRSATATAASRLGVPMIPAGVAFADSAEANPSIAVNGPDGHPTREGTYLAACTVYASLFGKSPVGNTFTGGLDAGVATALQQAAAKATGLRF
jgi:hypothetical protein